MVASAGAGHDGCMTGFRHIAVHIDRPADDVYEYVSDPANLPEWASGLSGSIEPIEGEWVSQSPMGQVIVRFADRNGFGVADHEVVLPGGQTFHNPLRVLADGAGSEIVFSLHRADGVSDDDYERDAATIVKDLETVRGILESE
jgi:uncharacterized protein YndB with AHSA1/START domain